MKQSRSLLVFVGLALIAFGAAGGWFIARQSSVHDGAAYASSVLERISALLSDNEKIEGELKSAEFAEPDASPTESYLIKIRRDGPIKNAQIKQKLDTVAENNAALVALIGSYLPYARTPQFIDGASKFNRYALTWRDRWNSVLEIFMAGGSLPTAGPGMPSGFSQAVRNELTAEREGPL